MTLEDYLHREQMELSTFSKLYNLDYHRLYRVKKGAMTKDEAIIQVFKQLGITYASKDKGRGWRAEYVVSFPRADLHFVREFRRDLLLLSSSLTTDLKRTLTRYRIPYYVRQADDHWLVKYDKEASGMINQVVLVGRTTKDIELRQTKNGTNYVQFTLAVNRAYKGSDQQADFINCVAWCKTAETMAQYVFKGTLIGIEGRLQVRTYQNEAGIRQYISEVLVNRFTFLEARKNSATPEPMEPT